MVYDVLLLLAYQRKELGGALALLLFAVATIALAWTQSRTEVAALAVAALLQLHGRYLLALMVPGVTALCALLTTGMLRAILEAIGRKGDVSDAASLAGRTDIWQYALAEAANAPILGHGFNSFHAATVDTWFTTSTYFAIAHTHNNFIEVLYSNGVVGLALFVGCLSVLLHRWQTRPSLARDLLVWALIIISFSEVPFSSATLLPNLVLYIVIALDAKENLCGS